MYYEDILYEVGGGRATITINRPEKLNAFRGRTILELCDAFERAGDDEAVGVIVFTGAGERAFCVGGDVMEPTRTMQEKRQGHILGPRLASSMRNNGTPIICRVRGWCIGGGNEFNIMSDLTITDTTGRFGQAGPKIGSAPLWWGCQLMPAIVGEKKAREILFLTRHYGAEGHLLRIRGALRRQVDGGLWPYRDRRVHGDGPNPAGAAWQLRQGQPGV